MLKIILDEPSPSLFPSLPLPLSSPFVPSLPPFSTYFIPYPLIQSGERCKFQSGSEGSSAAKTYLARLKSQSVKSGRNVCVHID